MFSGEESKHQNGVVFLVNKNIANAVISCTPISSRLISIRITAKPQNIGSDHDMTSSNIETQAEEDNHQTSPRVRFDIEKLKNPEMANILKQE